MVLSRRIAVLLLLAAFNQGAFAADAPPTTKPSAWERMKAYAHDQREKAVAEGERLIAETDQKIAELKEQAKHTKGSAKATYEESITDLQARKERAQAQLAKMKSSSSAVWEASKQGFSDACKDLDQAYDKAVAAVKR